MGRLARTGPVGRFAFGALAVFVIVGIALWLFVSAQLRAKQEEFAQFHAQFVTRSILDHVIGPNDLVSPMSGSRADDLRQLVRARIDVYPVVALRIWGPDGTILFSDDPALVGVRYADPSLAQALAGGIASRLETSRDNVNATDLALPSNIFATYLPLQPDWAATGAAPTAVVEVLQDYSGVQASFAELSRTLALTLAVGLTVLFILLLPVLRQAAQRLTQQTEALRQNAARLRALNEDLVEASRVKSEFMANISHELRTPLTGHRLCRALGGWWRWKSECSAVRRCRPDPLERSDLASTHRRYPRTVKDRRRDGHCSKRAVRHRRGNSRGPNVTGALKQREGPSVDVEIESPSMSVVGDPIRVRQILTNLLSNAIKFTTQGQIKVCCRRAADTTEVSVEDTGIGLSAGAIRYIFDGFRQADGSVTRRFGGAGLGLATARKLVELEGGQMGVESVEGVGSRFWFTLPTAPEPEKAVSATSRLESAPIH